MVTVDGTYDDVNRLASELADEREDWAFVNVNVRPYYAEGSKTIGFEIAEQLGWRLPTQIVVPVASGAQLVKIDKAFRELTALGLVAGGPVPGVRRAGHRLRAGRGRVRGRARRGAAGPAGHHRQVAGHRQPGRRPVRARRGAPHRRRGRRRRATTRWSTRCGCSPRTEGIFGETAGGVTLGVLRKLLAAGQLDPEAETVIINSGDGLKTLDAVTAVVDVPAPIRPTLEAFQEAVS